MSRSKAAIRRPLRSPLLSALAAVVALAWAPSLVVAQSAENVAVVINEASPASQKVGEYYIKKRGIPDTNVIRIRTVTGESIDRVAYLQTIEGPIASALGRHDLQDRVLYLVLTKGIPLRINGTPGQQGTVASVDSELAPLYRRLTGRVEAVRGRLTNPYYLGTRPLRDARPFSHREQEIFLVTRLDAFTVDEVLALIDRAQAPSREGVIVLDQRAGLSDNTGDEWLAEAARRLEDQGQGVRVALDTSMSAAAPREQVLGYYSWGSNDPQNRKRRSGMSFAAGAIAATYVSTDGRTLVPPPDEWVPSDDWNDKKTLFGGSPQSLIGDLIRDGATGVAGHVAEPYLQSTIRPDILFPAYLAGFNLAESFYLAMPHLSWQTIVIGDPLCRPFPGTALTRTDNEDPVDPQTQLPGIFSKRRLEVARVLMKGVAAEALPLLVAADARQLKGDQAGARRTLEHATEIAPNAAGAQFQLAQMYEREGDHARAIDRYRAVIKVQPNNAVALNNLAYSLAVRRNQPAEAHPLAKRAAALAPTNPMMLDTLGWIEHLVGNSPMAAKLLDIAARKAPEQPEVRLHAAVVFGAVGDLKAAETHLKEAIRLDPSLARREEVVALQRKLGQNPN